MDQSSQIFRSSQILSSGQKTQELKMKLKTFKNTLQEVGVILSFNDEPHKLKQEQSLILRDLNKILQGSDQACVEFVDGFKILCKKEKLFRKVLMLTRKCDANESTAKTKNEQIEQESLIKIFMKVVPLQSYLLEILLEEITNTAAEAAEDTSWLHLLLNPLCYLPYIKDPENLTTKLLDILEIATYPAQLEILNAIPEIIPDAQHCHTAKELCKLLDDKDDLTGAIVDCLNALGLDSSIRSEIQDKILAKITSGGTSLKVFPILITFLLTDCQSQKLGQILLKIRNAIDTLMLSSDKSKEKYSYKILIFHKLKAITESSQTIMDAWLNMMSNIKTVVDHKPVDYLLFFMLHNAAPFKRKIVEALFRKKVQSGLFKISQLEKVFEKYILDQLLKDYFNSIVDIDSSDSRSTSRSTKPSRSRSRSRDRYSKSRLSRSRSSSTYRCSKFTSWRYRP